MATMDSADAAVLAAINGSPNARMSASMKRRERRRKAAAAFLGGLALLAGSLALLGGPAPFFEKQIGQPRALAASQAAHDAVPRSVWRHLADLDVPDSAYGGTLPSFWHVTKSGGTMIQDLAQDCYGLTVASEVGALLEGAADEDSLRAVEVNEGSQHVNVDVTIAEGIERAGRLGLAQSGMADVLFTPLLVETTESILSEHYPGRMFALFRHPIERAVSQFYYLKNATWEPTYDESYGNMTLEQWAFSPLPEINWAVRFLVNKMEGPITMEDLEGAKEVLRRKCLVGLLDKMDKSVERFRSYFGWGEKPEGGRDPEADQCVLRRLGNTKRGNRNDHPFPLQQGDKVWKELERKNFFDMALYEYAKRLFEEQKTMVRTRVRERARARSKVLKEAAAKMAADAGETKAELKK